MVSRIAFKNKSLGPSYGETITGLKEKHLSLVLFFFLINKLSLLARLPLSRSYASCLLNRMTLIDYSWCKPQANLDQSIKITE